MSDVEPQPASAARIFGESLAKAQRYVSSLAAHGVERGLIGPRERERLWTRHILNCAAVSSLLHLGHVIDVGSGAGLPGIPLAIIRADVDFTLLEPMERRVAWLTEQVQDLALENVTVLRGRAQDSNLQNAGDQVTARAVSALSSLIPLVSPLAKPGGELLLLKGGNAAAELAAASKQVRAARLHDVEILALGAEYLEQPTTVVRATVDGE